MSGDHMYLGPNVSQPRYWVRYLMLARPSVSIVLMSICNIDLTLGYSIWLSHCLSRSTLYLIVVQLLLESHQTVCNCIIISSSYRMTGFSDKGFPVFFPSMWAITLFIYFCIFCSNTESLNDGLNKCMLQVYVDCCHDLKSPSTSSKTSSKPR